MNGTYGHPTLLWALYLNVSLVQLVQILLGMGTSTKVSKAQVIKNNNFVSLQHILMCLP